MTDARSRDFVDRVVSVVDHQTGGPQPDRCPSHVLLTVLASHADEDADAVWTAAEQAVKDGRLRYAAAIDEFWLLD